MSDSTFINLVVTIPMELPKNEQNYENNLLKLSFVLINQKPLTAIPNFEIKVGNIANGYWNVL